MTRTLRRFAALVLLVLPLAVAAQEPPQIDVIGGQAAALPIAVVPFAGSAGETDIAKVVAADLDRSGQFRSLPERDLVERPTRGSEVSYPTWRTLRQDYLLIGRIVPDGTQLRVEYELFDVARQVRVLGEAKIAPGAAWRMSASTAETARSTSRILRAAVAN